MTAIRAAIYCIYRAKNRSAVARLCSHLEGAAVTAHLWALDRVDPGLERWTRGVGPGGKFALLNRLYENHAPDPDSWVLLVDDDVEISRRGWARFLDYSRRAGFDLAQPAHGRGSHRSHEITRARLARARLTTFVEIGPVVLVSPRVRPQVMPFPPHEGMGWGLDFLWHDLHATGYRLGIVDAVRMRHTGQIAGSYDSSEDRRVVRAALDARGMQDVSELHHTLAVWPWWKARCPWRDRGDPRPG